ncbi:MAG: 1-acyl-sn-glycerol-3-phosphate acyltransferase [Alphaproteobacteria bacterium]|nr:1-acyl-sn-glycerol-3-phosphate acyltransferase [Alphaproteobacteria bacterium]
MTEPKLTPMIMLRSLAFALFFFTWAPIGSLLALLVSKITPNRAVFLKWIAMWVEVIDWGERRILNLRHEKIGIGYLPRPPFIAAVQHQSEWEAMQVPIWFPNAAIVLKQELLDVPLWGPCMELYGAIPVQRAKKGSDIRRMLSAGENFVAQKRAIVIFPQGTRVKRGESRPIQRGVGVLYEHLKIPVVPITLNSGEYWGRKKLFGFLSIHMPGTVRVTIHPAIPANLPRDEMMAKLQAVIEANTPTS